MKKKRSIVLFIAIIAIMIEIFVIVFLFKPVEVTPEEFDLIRVGMTYDDVCKIFGGEPSVFLTEQQRIENKNKIIEIINLEIDSLYNKENEYMSRIKDKEFIEEILNSYIDYLNETDTLPPEIISWSKDVDFNAAYVSTEEIDGLRLLYPLSDEEKANDASFLCFCVKDIVLEYNNLLEEHSFVLTNPVFRWDGKRIGGSDYRGYADIVFGEGSKVISKSSHDLE